MSELDGLFGVLTCWQFLAVLMAACLAAGLPWAAYAGHHAGSHGPGLLLIIAGSMFGGVLTLLSADTRAAVGFFGGGAAGLVVGVGITAVMTTRWVRAQASGG
ncbi:hypothetical protein AB0A98_22395 [Streptomyces chrestomyceticus]|uniref:hypothetical protein n=1 Tax=Streptomyces chrestomyceticus TaxID=68185 RepID=UPI0033D320E7